MKNPNNLFNEVYDLYLAEKDTKALKLLDDYSSDDLNLQVLKAEILLYPSKGKAKLKDIKRGLNLLETACKKGNGEAALKLGEIYAYDDLIENNLETAIEYWKIGVDYGDIECVLSLSRVYKDENKENFIEQIQLANLLVLDDKFKSIGYERLGWIYSNKSFKDSSDTKSLEFYNQACKDGSKTTCLKLLQRNFQEGNLDVARKYFELIQKLDTDGSYKSELNFWNQKLSSGPGYGITK